MADFCYECNHPERFHAGPCRADEGDCGCEQFVPEPEET